MRVGKWSWTYCLTFGLVFGAWTAARPGRGLANETKPADKPQAPLPGTLTYRMRAKVFSIQPDGKGATELVEMAREDAFEFQSRGACLSPDGALTFGKSRAEKGKIYLPDRICTLGLGRAGFAEVLVKMDGLEITHWAWAPDGKKLAFSSWDPKHFGRNWIFDTQTKKVRELKMPRFKQDGKAYAMQVLAWTPDGNGFLAAGDGIHLVKAGGSESRRLLEPGKSRGGFNYRLAPDGRSVLFVQYAEDGEVAIRIASVPKGEVRTVAVLKKKTDVCAWWSPDGRHIAYSATGTEANGDDEIESSITVMNSDGKRARKVVTEKHASGTLGIRLLDWR